QIKQVTKDQTYVQTLIDAGKLSQEEAFSHPDRNIILQAIGGHHRQLSPAMHRIKLEPNDQILLCSDGLYEYLTDVEIAKILAEHTPTEAVEEMVNRAKARGGHDNITLIVLTAGSRTTPSQPLSFTQEITTS
ncbi:MAG: SpoIIE family protein phosphatase, partial [Saprospiraceae bacterium]|nr:SpoIIE family protein phosphatase [Saprospiraceae bacterium]